MFCAFQYTVDLVISFILAAETETLRVSAYDCNPEFQALAWTISIGDHLKELAYSPKQKAVETIVSPNRKKN